jgi:hypothetical protein
LIFAVLSISTRTSCLIRALSCVQIILIVQKKLLLVMQLLFCWFLHIHRFGEFFIEFFLVLLLSLNTILGYLYFEFLHPRSAFVDSRNCSVLLGVLHQQVS